MKKRIGLILLVISVIIEIFAIILQVLLPYTINILTVLLWSALVLVSIGCYLVIK